MGIFKKRNSIVHATSEGRLYITTEDFFQQPEIKQMILDIVSSDTFKAIEEEIKENNKNEEANTEIMEKAIS